MYYIIVCTPFLLTDIIKRLFIKEHVCPVFILKGNCLVHKKHTRGDTGSAFKAHRNREFANIKLLHLLIHVHDSPTIKSIIFKKIAFRNIPSSSISYTVLCAKQSTSIHWLNIFHHIYCITLDNLPSILFYSCISFLSLGEKNIWQKYLLQLISR